MSAYSWPGKIDEIAERGCDRLYLAPGDRPGRTITLFDEDYAFATFVVEEASIPLAVGTLRADPNRKTLAGGKRPWVRVGPAEKVIRPPAKGRGAGRR